MFEFNGKQIESVNVAEFEIEEGLELVEMYELFIYLVELTVDSVALVVNFACVISDLVVLFIRFEWVHLGQHLLTLIFYFFTVNYEAALLCFFVVFAFNFEFVEQILFICQRSQLYLLHFQIQFL